MPALGSTFKNIFPTQTPLSSVVVTIPIDILDSEKKLKEKKNYTFMDELVPIISSNTALLSG